jgi:tRNA (guanine-N7-)-methyltransferase
MKSPFTRHSPPSPAQMDWSTHFPAFFEPPAAEGQGSKNSKGKKVEFADVGCGFGGLSISLAPLFPETLMLGAFLSPMPSTPSS